MPPYAVCYGSLLLPTFRSNTRLLQTCYDVWTKAKKVYSNDAHRFYSVLTSLMNIKLENMDMQTYLNKLDHLTAEYSTVFYVLFPDAPVLLFLQASLLHFS